MLSPSFPTCRSFSSKNIYNKIKDNLIVNVSLNKEKFSIINDIYKFLENYNKTYSANINLT